MKKFPLDLSKFKKVSGDDKLSVLRHADGHELKIAHSKLSPALKEQLNKLPTVEKFSDGGESGEQTDDAQAEAAPVESKQDQESLKVFDPTLMIGKAPAGYTATPEQGAVQLPKTDIAGLQSLGEAQIAALEKQKAGQMMQAEAMGKAGEAQASGLAAGQKKIEDQMADYTKANNELLKERTNLQTEVLKGQIKPRDYLDNMGTGHKIRTALGLILGGMGAGLTHGHNMAFEFLKNQIDHDLEAQKTNLGIKENLLAHNYRATQDLRAASELTRLQTNDIMGLHLKQLAAQATNPQVQGMLLDIAGKFDNQSAQVQHQIALNKMMYGGVQGDVDPAKMVPLLVPKEHQTKAFGEIEAAENTRKMSKSILDAFEDAAKENTVMRTGAGLLRTPGSVYALHQSMQPTFKDLEGTVRQAAMDNTFKNITPAPGDSEHTIETKRQALREYLRSKQSAPTARAYGIDLGKFQQTAPHNPLVRVRAPDGSVRLIPMDQVHAAVEAGGERLQ
jgi:hypothetical protein